MCGIAGYYSTTQTIAQAHLEVMTNALSHRGPDAAGYYADEFIGLGHRRLSILDLSHAADQPMTAGNGRHKIIFNGEVYNFKEVAKELDVPLKTTGDTEVLLEAYVKWGPAGIEKFNGMFTLAIYDQHDKTLFLARDRMGIKPLYYYYDGELLAFASELKALVAFPLLQGKLSIDQNALREFLYLGYIPAPNSIYQQIRKFPQGAMATIGPDQPLDIRKYYELRAQVHDKTLDNEQQATAKLNELVNSSVSYRMVSDVPFGTFLSGGIDSSLVTAVAQHNSSVPVNTFSIGFPESDKNEASYARQVADHLGTKHHEFEVSHKEALELFDDILDVYDEPFADSSSVPTMLVCKLARQHVTMTLSGDGGDETYMGYGFYNWAERLNKPWVKALRGPISAALSAGSSRYERASYMFRQPRPGRQKSYVFSQEQYYFTEDEIDDILQPNWGQGDITIDENFEVARKLSPSEEQALFDMHYYLPDDLLVKVDRASMRYSLEARVPLLDHRLVEFALNVNQNLKLRDNTMKYLLKQVLYQYLPKELFERPKWGFGMPISQWLKKELRYLPDTYLSKQVVEEAGLVKWQGVNSLLKQYYSGKDYLYNRIWVLILLHRWYLKHHS